MTATVAHGGSTMHRFIIFILGSAIAALALAVVSISAVAIIAQTTALLSQCLIVFGLLGLGAVVVGSTESMVKLSEADAQKIQQTTGKAPADLSEQELQQAMQQTGVKSQPITADDQKAMAAAEAADPNKG